MLMVMNKMHKPARPGTMINHIMEELGLNVAETAEQLGITSQTLNHLIDSGVVSPEMAVRLEEVFGSTAANWLRMQANYDGAPA